MILLTRVVEPRSKQLTVLDNRDVGRNRAEKCVYLRRDTLSRATGFDKLTEEHAERLEMPMVKLCIHDCTVVRWETSCDEIRLRVNKVKLGGSLQGLKHGSSERIIGVL